MNKQRWILWALTAGLILSSYAAGSQSQGTSNTALSQSTPALVNVMIDYDTPPHPTSDQINASHRAFTSIIKEIFSRNINATVFLTTEVSSTRERLYLTTIGQNPGIEYALGGNSSGERLSTKSYSEQSALLKAMKRWADLTYFCGINTRDVRGFKPQLFDQNEDTFRVLDEMGMAYDAGFKAGLLYIPGHESDRWPYPVENHTFYAVPVSTFELSGEKVHLQDRFMKEEMKMGGHQWEEILISSFDESSRSGVPFVAIFSASLSGSGDYLGAFRRFLDHAESMNARFITTMELVNITRSGVANDSLKSVSIPAGRDSAGGSADESVCVACDSLNNDGLKVTARGDANYTVQNGSMLITLEPISFDDSTKS